MQFNSYLSTFQVWSGHLILDLIHLEMAGQELPAAKTPTALELPNMVHSQPPASVSEKQFFEKQ